MHKPNPFPTGTITFLFTDIEGSTRLWELHPDAMQAAVARHDALLRQAVADNGGYLFKTTGDGIAAAFAVAADGLAAALTAQRALLSEPWPAPVVIRSRMGLHTGTAELRDRDYFGPTLNRAARIMAAGHGGQTLLSEATSERCRDALLADMSLQSLGERRLKDLSRPEILYQLSHPALMSAFPPLRTLDATPNNLPQQVTSFVGREKALAHVAELLEKTRLLTLTGGGGNGKTRLSLQSAAALLEQYADGVWFVELASLSDPALVPQTVAMTVGVREQPGQTITQALIDHLKAKRLLLVLDNCEHLLPACASLTAALLRACPQVKALATSREPLGIAGEQLFRVPPLSLPESKPKRPHTPESLSRFEAVRLFAERAQAVKPDFTVTDANATALAQLCSRLDGIPLAIELAAARVRSLTVEQINDRLDNRFRLLVGGDRSALPRQQTLRALVDWSYDLLTDGEKTLFARLSVFAGGWTLAAAETVCGVDPLEDWEVLDLLTSLVDKSLVQVEEQGEAVRYHLLETLRQYGAEKAVEGGETASLQERHRDWCVALSEQAEPHLQGAHQGLWLDRLEIEHDNLRAALHVSRKSGAETTRVGSPESIGPLPGLRLAATLWRFWDVRDHLTEGREHLRQILDFVDAASEVDSSVSAGGYARKVQVAESRARAGAARLAERQGDYPAAQVLLEKSLPQCRAHGDKRGTALSLMLLGNVAKHQGDFSVAKERYEEGLRFFREVDDRWGIGSSVLNLGIIAKHQGDFPQARRLYEEGLSLNRETGNKEGAAISLIGLGTVALNQGDFKEAQAWYEESLGLSREVDDKAGIAGTLMNLGNSAYFQGDLPKAASLYEECLTLSQEIGNKWNVAAALSNLGSIASSQENYAAARGFYRQSLPLLREMGSKHIIADGLEGVAAVDAGEGDWRRAVVLWAAAIALRESVGAPLPPVEQTEQDEKVARARAALSEKSFVEAWNEGSALSWEKAVGLLLGEAE